MKQVKQVILAHQALQSLVGFDRDGKVVLPSSERFRLAGLIRKTREVVEDFIESKNAIVRRLGALDENGNLQVTPENDAAFKAEVDALMNAEVDITIAPIKPKDLGSTQVPIDLIVALQDGGILENG